VTPRICFVTCRRWPQISESDRVAQRALEARGAVVEGRPWDEPAAEFDGFDAVVLRSNWEYHLDPDRFRAWLDGLERTGARIWNAPDLVRWNLSKRYLLALHAAGVPTVPAVLLDAGGRPDDIAALMARHGWPRAVIKPEYGASSHDTRLITAATARDAAAALERGTLRGPTLIQPFVEEIVTRGEWSLIFIDSVFTHAVLKRPAAGDFRVQPRLGGRVESGRPPHDVLAAAQTVMVALPHPPLYARIDGVETRDGFRIMEVEVNEPSLFFTHAPQAAERLADAILRDARECYSPRRLP
jgi:glutathione synthase/RimK-type ligase-like ATP-grasp enzyme